MTADPPDEVLMARYAKGDVESFERLFERHRRPLFTFLLHATGERARAEDLFQEVFLRVIRGRERYDSAKSFRAWLFTIARNALHDARRRAGVRAEEDGAPLAADHAPSPEHGPVARLHAKDLAERLEAALARLPDELRDVFLLRERGGLDFQEVARVAGCGLETAKSRMRYALAHLRRHLSTGRVPEGIHEGL